MVNLSTPSDLLMKELSAEYDKAKYWLIKHFGGEKGYEEMRDRLLAKCQYSHEPQTSDVVEYTSRNGNRWLCYEHAIYYPESYDSHTMPYAFCFFETAGSIGIFCLCFSGDERMTEPISCIIFTPHFFQRFAERLGIEMGGSSMARRFVECLPYMNISQYEPDDDGVIHVDVRLPGSLGRGIRRKGKEAVFEVRTFLADKQLTKAQNSKTATIRDWGDKVKYEPQAMMKSRLAHQENPLETFLEDLKKKEALGFDTSMAQEALRLSMSITNVFNQMQVASPTDFEFWTRHGENAGDAVRFFLKRQEDEGDNFEFFKEFVALGCEIARRDGIRKFKRRDFIRQSLITLWQWSQEDAEKLAETM